MLTVTPLEISPAETLVRVYGIDDRAPWMFQPFESGPAHFAAAVAEGRILAANEAGELALFDQQTRSCVRRGSLGRTYKHLRGLVLRGGKRAVLYTRTDLVAIDCETLDIQIEAHGLRRKMFGPRLDLVPEAPVPGNEDVRPIRIDPKPDLIEHEDGTLIAAATLLQTGKNDGPVLYGVLAIDLERGTATQLIAHEAQDNYYRNGFLWFSPSGRYGVRFHYGSIPWHDGRNNRRHVDIVNRSLGKGGRSELPDCRFDGVERIGTALEVWRIKPLKPVAKPVVRMQPVDAVWSGQTATEFARAIDFAATKPGAPFRYQMNMAHAKFVGHPRKVMDLDFKCLAWEPDETAFWMLIGDHHLRRIALGGQVSPLFAVPRIRDSRLKRYGGANFEVRDDTLRSLGDDRIRIVYGGDQIVRAPVPRTPTIGSELVVTEESFTPGVPLNSPLVPNASSAPATFTKTIIELPDLTEASVLAALETLTNRIEVELSDMIHSVRSQGEHIRTVFFTPTHALDERTFFDFAAEQYPAALPAIRRLIMTFSLAPSPGPRNMRLIYTENEGAFAHAALALARFDPGAVEALSAYITSANVGQSSFIRDDLAPAYFQSHGWQGETGVRLGVRFVVAEHSHGIECVRHYWEKIGLREAARQLSPDLFAHILFTERKGRRSEVDKRAIIAAWLEVLEDKSSAFDAAVKSALLTELHSTGPEAIVRLRDAVAFIEETSPSIDHVADSFCLLEIRSRAYALLSAREFGDLIVAATYSRVGATLEDRIAAGIIHKIRSIAKTLDATNDYDVEVLQVLRSAMKDTVARLRVAERPHWSTPRWFTHLLLGPLERLHRNTDRDEKRNRAIAIIEDLCRIPDPSEPFDAEVIAALHEASREMEPWNWRGWGPKTTPTSPPEA